MSSRVGTTVSVIVVFLVLAAVACSETPATPNFHAAAGTDSDRTCGSCHR